MFRSTVVNIVSKYVFNYTLKQILSFYGKPNLDIYMFHFLHAIKSLLYYIVSRVTVENF